MDSNQKAADHQKRPREPPNLNPPFPSPSVLDPWEILWKYTGAFHLENVSLSEKTELVVFLRDKTSGLLALVILCCLGAWLQSVPHRLQTREVVPNWATTFPPHVSGRVSVHSRASCCLFCRPGRGVQTLCSGVLRTRTTNHPIGRTMTSTWRTKSLLPLSVHTVPNACVGLSAPSELGCQSTK